MPGIVIQRNEKNDLDLQKTFANNLSYLLTKKGITAKAVADATGVAESIISNYWSGKQKSITTSTFEKVINYLLNLPDVGTLPIVDFEELIR